MTYKLWNYRIIELDYDYVPMNLEEHLNSFGFLGWELISILYLGNEKYRYAFKREVK